MLHRCISTECQGPSIIRAHLRPAEHSESTVLSRHPLNVSDSNRARPLQRAASAASVFTNLNSAEMSFCCGLFRKKAATPAPQRVSDGLQGVEFSPRNSYASSHAPHRVSDGLQGVEYSPRASYASSHASGPAIVIAQNPELIGYYAPGGSAGPALPAASPSQELRGYYEPDLARPAVPRVSTRKNVYL